MRQLRLLTLLPIIALVLLSLSSPARAGVAEDNNVTPNQPNFNLKPAAKAPTDAELDAQAQASSDDKSTSPPPPAMADLQEQANGQDAATAAASEADQMGLQIRADALREAALSYGARGGLAYRTFEIQRRLAEYDASMGKAFDFKRLLIAAPSGLLIEPPVVSEAQQAVIVTPEGQAAAVADRVYRINRKARIVTAAKDWRLYLERDWGKVDPPPKILLPHDDIERAYWRRYVKEGWAAGVTQAEDIFEADLDRMNADFTGMIRYRELLSQGMISPPFALADDRGITGGGNEMRVGDRGIAITGQSQLLPSGGKALSSSGPAIGGPGAAPVPAGREGMAWTPAPRE